MTAGCLIVGGGHAGFHTANALRDKGYTAPVTILEAAPGLPYERPPLSKAYLLGEATAEGLLFRPATYYDKRNIRLCTGTPVRALDAVAHTVATDDQTFEYDDLVLATGSRPRKLQVPGAELTGIHRLATRADADQLRSAFSTAKRLVIIGAGFIGLEAAAVATDAGIAATVIELAERGLKRAASAPLAAHLQAWHEERGVSFHTQTGLTAFTGHDGHLTGVVDAAGVAHPADIALVGIGAVPVTDLAAAAGFPTDAGITVNNHLRVSDHVYAIGDCARYPHALFGENLRLESVQNATDHARCVADALTGNPHPYRAVPWFWSDQGSLKIQIAGLTTGAAHQVTRGDPASGRFSIYCYARDGGFLGVESIGRVAEHVNARKLLAAGIIPPPERIADPDYNPKQLLAT